MRGVYDYRGECFGYIVRNKLYDLDNNHVGYIEEKAVTSLDHRLIWHVDRDGLYDKHWHTIGYISGPKSEGQGRNYDEE